MSSKGFAARAQSAGDRNADHAGGGRDGGGGGPGSWVVRGGVCMVLAGVAYVLKKRWV